MDAELPKGLELIDAYAFEFCTSLRRISMPLTENMIEEEDLFNACENLERVDLVGGIHTTVASLHLESWKNEMSEVIDRINQILPETHHSEKNRGNTILD